MDAIIRCTEVSKAYGGVIANDRISLEVPAGRITGLIGPNGSGKTTLFNSIVGYHPIDAGSITFEGREISRLRTQQISRLGLLRTFQQTRVYKRMNCVENMLVSIPNRSDAFWSMFRGYPPTRRGGPSACSISSGSIRNGTSPREACPSVSKSCSNSRWRL